MTPPDDSRDVAPLTPERWARVRALVEEVIALPLEARPAFLSAACGDDHALHSRVEHLAAAYDGAGESWGFLAHPAGELVAPLLIADETVTPDAARPDRLPAAFHAALADRYVVQTELGRGGMATVYKADDLRHHRRVALKVLDPRLAAMLGAERFLAEIRVTASLQHPNLLPLFDSGEAGGLLYYVSPLMEGATLRARLQRERQLPVDEAVRLVRTIAGALDYAHRQGVVHRDLKPENILLQEGEPLVADFGISLAVARAGSGHLTAPGISLGTPQYMSPEQAAGDPAINGRSDVYSLACVLHELLVGEPPFTGRTVDVVIAKVLGELPAPVRTLRPSVPAHVEAAIIRALSKLPADRYATAREFGEALARPSVAVPDGVRPTLIGLRTTVRFALGVAATVALTSAAWIALRKSPDVSRFVERNLIGQSLSTAITITPDGRALVYTASADRGRLLVLRPLDQRPERVLAGSEAGLSPFVSPDGQRVAFIGRDAKLKTVSIDLGGTTESTIWSWSRNGRLWRWLAPEPWRYGNGKWINDSVIVSGSPMRGLMKREPGTGTLAVIPRADSAGADPTWAVLTQPNTANGEVTHAAPLVIPGRRAVVFTVRRRGGPGVITGSLAIASIDPDTEPPKPHVLLGVTARRAIAYVDGWLLFTTPDGKAIHGVRLDVERRRILGNPISVLEDERGDIESASLADNGTLLYIRWPRTNSALLVDSGGAVHPALARGVFMHPRISPDGKRFAVQVTSADGQNDDVWVYDMASRTPMQLTTSGKALHPTWTPDGRRIVYFAAGSRRLMSQPSDGGVATEIPATEGAFAPAVVGPDGRAVVFQRGRTDGSHWSVWSASLRGPGAARRILDDPSSPYMPAVSPDGRWLAYASRATGRDEIYVRSFPGPGAAVQVSADGGNEPAWSPDGRRLYYLAGGALMAVDVTAPALAITSRRQLFKASFDEMPHRNYDVTPDGSAFLIITAAANPEAVVTLNWLTELRARLERAR